MPIDDIDDFMTRRKSPRPAQAPPPQSAVDAADSEDIDNFVAERSGILNQPAASRPTPVRVSSPALTRQPSQQIGPARRNPFGAPDIIGQAQSVTAPLKTAPRLQRRERIEQARADLQQEGAQAGRSLNPVGRAVLGLGAPVTRAVAGVASLPGRIGALTTGQSYNPDESGAATKIGALADYMSAAANPDQKLISPGSIGELAGTLVTGVGPGRLAGAVAPGAGLAGTIARGALSGGATMGALSAGQPVSNAEVARQALAGGVAGAAGDVATRAVAPAIGRLGARGVKAIGSGSGAVIGGGSNVLQEAMLGNTDAESLKNAAIMGGAIGAIPGIVARPGAPRPAVTQPVDRPGQGGTRITNLSAAQTQPLTPPATPAPLAGPAKQGPGRAAIQTDVRPKMHRAHPAQTEPLAPETAPMQQAAPVDPRRSLVDNTRAKADAAVNEGRYQDAISELKAHQEALRQLKRNVGKDAPGERVRIEREIGRAGNEIGDLRKQAREAAKMPRSPQSEQPAPIEQRPAGDEPTRDLSGELRTTQPETPETRVPFIKRADDTPQPSNTAAIKRPTSVEVGGKSIVLTDAQAQRWAQEVDEPLRRAQERYDADIAMASRLTDSADAARVRDKANRDRKAAGMRIASVKRDIVEALTPKERQAKAKKEQSNYGGKRVSVDGINGQVVNVAFGRVKIKLDDGRTITSTPDRIGAPLPDRPMQSSGRIDNTEPTNRITEGAGDEMPRRFSRPLEGQPIEPPTRYTEYEGGEMQRYSGPLEGQPIEIPERPKPLPRPSTGPLEEPAYMREMPHTLRETESYRSPEDARRGKFEPMEDAELDNTIKQLEAERNAGIRGKSKLDAQELHQRSLELQTAKAVRRERLAIQRKQGYEPGDRLAPYAGRFRFQDEELHRAAREFYNKHGYYPNDEAEVRAGRPLKPEPLPTMEAVRRAPLPEPEKLTDERLEKLIRDGERIRENATDPPADTIEWLEKAKQERAKRQGPNEPEVPAEPTPSSAWRDDKESFSLGRVNQQTQNSETQTFSRGEYVKVRLAKDQFAEGEITGISHANRQVRIGKTWHDFGAVYKAERPEAPARPKERLSRAIERSNAKFGAGLTEADRVPPTPARTIQHSDFGEVTPAENQRGVGRGKMRVVDAEGGEHIIQKPTAGRGNRKAAMTKAEAITKVAAGSAQFVEGAEVTPIKYKNEPIAILKQSDRSITDRKRDDRPRVGVAAREYVLWGKDAPIDRVTLRKSTHGSAWYAETTDAWRDDIKTLRKNVAAYINEQESAPRGIPPASVPDAIKSIKPKPGAPVTITALRQAGVSDAAILEAADKYEVSLMRGDRLTNKPDELLDDGQGNVYVGASVREDIKSLDTPSTAKDTANYETQEAKQATTAKPTAANAEPRTGRGSILEPVKASGRTARGAGTSLKIPRTNKEYAVRYEVRELGDIQPSHNPFTFEKNPDYRLVNDRDYSTPANRIDVEEATKAGAFDPRLILTDDPTATNGPPIVYEGGDVLGGNSRTMMLARVYRNHSAEGHKYRQALESRAAMFGLKPEDLKRFDQPILVRVIDAQPENLQKLITDLNVQPGKAMSSTEAASARAKSMPAETMQFLSEKLGLEGPDGTLAQALEGQKGVNILNRLIQDDVIPKGERNRYLTDHGALTQSAKAEIETMLLGRMFRDADQMKATAPEMRNKLARVAPHLAKTAGTEWDVSNLVPNALDAVSAAKNQHIDLEMLNQRGFLFGDAVQYSPEELAVARLLKEFGPRQIENKFREYAAEFESSQRGAGLFGDPPTQREAFDTVFKPARDNGPSKPQFVLDAEKRLKDVASGKLAGSGGQALVDQAIVTGYKVYRAGMDFATWAREVIKETGETVRPHLRAAWNQLRADERAGVDLPGKAALMSGRTAPLTQPLQGKPQDTLRLGRKPQAPKTAKPGKATPPDQEAGTLEKAAALRKAGLLARVPTHLRNMLGNTAFQATEELSRVPAAIADIALSAVTKRRTITTANPAAVGRAAYEAATKGVKEAKRIFKEGADAPTAERTQMREVKFDSKILNAYVNGNFRLLAAEDQIFKTYALKRSLESRAKAQAITEARQGQIKRSQIDARAKELTDNPTTEMAIGAAADAEVATFQNNNPLSSGVSTIRREMGRGGNFALDMILPFDRTPTNIVLRTLESTPLGYAKNAAQIAKAIANKAMSAEDQKAFAQTFGRATIGSGVVYLGYALAAKGLMTGFYDDHDREGEAARRDAGQQPVALLDPNTGRSYAVAAMAPVGTLLGIGATLYRETHKPPNERHSTASRVAKGFGHAALEMPLLKTAKDVIDATASGDKFSEKTGRIAGSFVPGWASDIGTLTDKHERQSKGFVGQIQGRVPGWRNQLPAKEAGGQPVPTEWGDVVDPFRSRPMRHSAKLDANHVKTGRIAEWTAEYEGQLKAHPRFATLTTEQQQRAVASLRSRMQHQANEKRPNTASFAASRIIAGILRSEREKPRRDAGKLYVEK